MTARPLHLARTKLRRHRGVAPPPLQPCMTREHPPHTHTDDYTPLPLLGTQPVLIVHVRNRVTTALPRVLSGGPGFSSTKYISSTGCGLPQRAGKNGRVRHNLTLALPRSLPPPARRESGGGRRSSAPWATGLTRFRTAVPCKGRITCNFRRFALKTGLKTLKGLLPLSHALRSTRTIKAAKQVHTSCRSCTDHSYVILYTDSSGQT